MGRIRDAVRNAGGGIIGERAASIVGWCLSLVLIIAVVAIVTGIVMIGFNEGMRALRDSQVDQRLQLFLFFVFACVAVAVLIAVIPTLVRSIFGPAAVWWTNLFRTIALLSLAFLIMTVAPLDIVPSLWSSLWGDRDAADGMNGEPVGIIPDTPHALPSGIAAIRRQAILERYWRFLAHYGDDGLRRRYERVKQWRPLTERYATAAGLDTTRVESVMMTESAGQPEITSRANARGLMQVLDSGARNRADLCGTYNPPVDSYDPEKGICAGVDELRGLSATKYPNDWENVLAGYNWGIGNLERALDHAKQRWPKQPRSFWVLWDKKDPAFVASLPRAETKEGKNPEGWLLFNYGKNPDESRHYVPSVLAWEYIIRYMDAHDGTPPPRDGDREPPRVARGGRRMDRGEEVGRDTDGIAAVVDPRLSTPDSRLPTSSVWYTVQRGEGIGDVLLLFREPTETIVALNADVVAESGVAVGTKVRLPDTRYAFYRANGSESYRDIAARHGMSVADLLRWAGRWTTEEAILARHRDCPPDGCDDELAVASTGEQLLVRRQN
ncbi:transglycosylase SLT domain-containing protein [Candidatus Uhrbacteria bacterium]|nr:transglycosylase SLT domain-containing protein [Candidatus Uhrbacteria bacterium]